MCFALWTAGQAASEWLRKKGLASADKKAGRLAAEGGVVSYIHPGSRLGVLLEVNCETDFVAAGEVFNKLANTVAMQVSGWCLVSCIGPFKFYKMFPSLQDI